MNRRELLYGAAMTTAAMALPRFAFTQQNELGPIFSEITRRHDETVERLRAGRAHSTTRPGNGEASREKPGR